MAQEHEQLTASVRTALGNGPTRRLRREGRTPGILYQKGGDSIALAFDTRELWRAVSGTGRTSVIDVAIDGHWLAAGSLAAAGFALAAALISVIVAHLLGAESQLITAGLIGFNPILTAVALGTVFYRPGPRVMIYALLATALTVIVQGAMISVLTPFGIPTLTAAFVLVTWLFLLPGQKFD